MFTGIIKHSGVVKSKEKSGSGIKLIVTVDELIANVSPGDSISVNGSCLTLVESEYNDLFFDVIAETLDRTTVGILSVGDVVNIEYSMKLNDFVGGHLVSGHVDFVSELLEIDDNKYWYSKLSDYSKFFVEKGSVTINGVSLTINEVSSDRFRVDLIPETLSGTNLNDLKVSSRVNIEIDLIARYLEKLI
jgi:riboflavin synthase